MKKLPIGLQNLREMRTQGYVYVDKTAHVARLAEEGKYSIVFGIAIADNFGI